MESVERSELTVGEVQAIHPAVRKVWQISSVLRTLLFATILSVPEWLIVRELEGSSWPFRIPVVAPTACLLLGGFGFYLARKRFEMWSYQLREFDLVMTHGVYMRTRRCVARERVQHVDISSGPIDRHFGLVHISIHVAGGASGVGSIPGLTPEKAEALRVALLERRAADA